MTGVVSCAAVTADCGGCGLLTLKLCCSALSAAHLSCLLLLLHLSLSLLPPLQELLFLFSLCLLPLSLCSPASSSYCSIISLISMNPASFSLHLHSICSFLFPLCLHIFSPGAPFVFSPSHVFFVFF